MEYVEQGDPQRLLFADERFNKVVHAGKTCRLLLTTDNFICKDIDSETLTCCVGWGDIIGCREAVSTKKTAHDFEHRSIEVYCYRVPQASCCHRSLIRRRQVILITVVNEEACENVMRVIRCVARGISVTKQADGSYSAPPPRKHLVFINPVGGQGKAVSIWQKHSEPLFREADIDCSEFVTERANHARDICAECDFAAVDGIVIVGGDGLIFEVVSGIASREDKDTVFGRLPLIPIPGGSGNGLAKSIMFESGEEYSALSAAFVGVKGSPSPLDMSQVTTTSHEYMSFLLLGWGLVSDSDILSERLRWMGEPRFSVAGAYFLMKRNLYKGRLSLLRESGHAWQDGEAVELPPLDQPLDNASGAWEVIEDDFLLVWIGQTSHCSASMYSSPGATMSDGVFTILVVRQNFSRLDMARMLLALDSSGDHFKHPKAEIYRTRAYRLEPQCDEGLYTLDGERIEYGPIQASMRPNALKVMTIPYSRS